MCRRFLSVFSSGTRRNSRSGLTPFSGLPSGGSRTTSVSVSWVRRQPSACCQKVAARRGSVESTQTHCQRREGADDGRDEEGGVSVIPATCHPTADDRQWFPLRCPGQA